jgi:hypothetical protein
MIVSLMQSEHNLPEPRGKREKSATRDLEDEANDTHSIRTNIFGLGQSMRQQAAELVVTYIHCPCGASQSW